jgi:hypothetical protein
MSEQQARAMRIMRLPAAALCWVGHKNKAAGLRDLARRTFSLRAIDLLGT